MSESQIGQLIFGFFLLSCKYALYFTQEKEKKIMMINAIRYYDRTNKASFGSKSPLPKPTEVISPSAKKVAEKLEGKFKPKSETKPKSEPEIEREDPIIWPF